MSQLYDKATVCVEDQLVEDLGDWIDPYALASMVIWSIKDEFGSVTLEQGKDFWYRALEFHLNDTFEQIARTLPDPADEE